MLTVRVDDSQLQRKIAQLAVVKNITIKDQTRQAFKSLLKYAVDYTPPGSQGATGSRAKIKGEQAVDRDLNRMGLEPVQIKGKKVYKTTFWGHKLSQPLEIPTKINPRFADPEAIRKTRLAHKHGSRVTRGQKQAFYVDERLFKPMRNRLIREVGRLASGWVVACNQLGVKVPAWIARHSETFGRGTPVIITETKTKLTMQVTNRFPEGTLQAGIVADMQRRIEIFRGYVINNLQRQLDFFLKKGLRAVK